MNIKKFTLSVISYVVLTLAWAYPWHMVWFHELYSEMGAFTRAEPIMAFGILSMLIQGAVIAYLFPFYLQGENSTVAKGVTFSLIIGLMVYTVMGFANAAKFDINPVSTFLLYHTAFQAVQFILTGAALGFIFKEKSSL